MIRFRNEERYGRTESEAEYQILSDDAGAAQVGSDNFPEVEEN